jgi:hypothetical protein
LIVTVILGHSYGATPKKPVRVHLLVDHRKKALSVFRQSESTSSPMKLSITDMLRANLLTASLAAVASIRVGRALALAAFRPRSDQFQQPTGERSTQTGEGLIECKAFDRIRHTSSGSGFEREKNGPWCAMKKHNADLKYM